MIRLTFLGTGTSQGVPVISCGCWVCRSDDSRDKRLRTSALVETGRTTLLIDAGPDFRQQMLRESVGKLDGILLTHEHKDHIAGLDDVRAFNYVTGKASRYLCRRAGATAGETGFRLCVFRKSLPGVPEIRLHTILPDAPFRIGDAEIVPIRGIHYKLPVFGFRIGRLAYLTDMNRIDDRELKKIEGVDTLVINALRKKNITCRISRWTKRCISVIGCRPVPPT